MTLDRAQIRALLDRSIRATRERGNGAAVLVEAETLSELCQQALLFDFLSNAMRRSEVLEQTYEKSSE